MIKSMPFHFFLTAFVIFGRPADVSAQYTYPEREAWQKPALVVERLDIEPGSTVADIGAGDGYFVYRFARAVGESGKVFAVEISTYHLRQIREEAQRRNLFHIEVVKAKTDDPRLPDHSVDLVFLCNTYHHLEDRTAYFKNLKNDLKPNARVVIIDYLPGHTPYYGHSTATEIIISEMNKAGYVLERQYDFLPKQNFLIFTVQK
jgi:ubiquinone/menaquinone biosynthesis C-methylase UbiE